MDAGGSISPGLFSNPAVIGGGIGGIIALVLIAVMYKMLVRIDDTIHQFIDGQVKVIDAIRMAGDSFTGAVREMTSDLREGQTQIMREQARQSAKLEVLLDRGQHTFEQVAIHRGVSETAQTGTPPAIVTPTAKAS